MVGALVLVVVMMVWWCGGMDEGEGEGVVSVVVVMR